MIIKPTGNLDLRNSLVDLYDETGSSPIRYTLSQFLDKYEEEITVYDALGIVEDLLATGICTREEENGDMWKLVVRQWKPLS